MKYLSAMIVGGMLATTAGSASAITFDFNQFSDGDVLSGQRIDFGGGVFGQITADSTPADGTNQAVIFDQFSSTALSNDPDLVGDNGVIADVNGILPDRSFGNVLIIQEGASRAAPNGGPDDEAGGGILTFSFETAINLLSISLLDGEEEIDVTAGGTTFAETGGADDQFETVLTNIFGIDTFTVDFGGSGGVGEFEFTSAISEVPLPASLPLFIAALAGFGWVSRRRKLA